MPSPLCSPIGCSALQSLFLVPLPSTEAQCMTFQTPHSSRVGGTLPMRGNGLVCSALSLHLNGLKGRASLCTGWQSHTVVSWALLSAGQSS